MDVEIKRPWGPGMQAPIGQHHFDSTAALAFIRPRGQFPCLEFVLKIEEAGVSSVALVFNQGRNRREQLNGFLSMLHYEIEKYFKENAPERLPEG